MFVDKTSSCWVDIRDTETEIIMNNHITPYTDSPHGKDVSIELYDKSTMKQIEIKKDNDGKNNIVYIEDFRESGADSVVLPFQLKLHVVDNPELGDLQYVMDAKVFPEMDDEEEGGGVPRMKAEFTHSHGCDKSRANGRKGDNGLTVNVSIPASIFSLSNVKDQAVDVVAGWACGHEAVKLTESIQFRPMPKEQVEQHQLDAKEIDIIPEKSDEKEMNNEQLEVVDVKEISRNIRRRHNDEVREHLLEMKKQRMEERNDGSENTKKHRHLNLQKLNQFYEKTRFGKASFTNHKYLKGLFVIFLGVIILRCCIAKGKKTKGRRDL